MIIFQTDVGMYTYASEITRNTLWETRGQEKDTVLRQVKQGNEENRESKGNTEKAIINNVYTSNDYIFKSDILP